MGTPTPASAKAMDWFKPLPPQKVFISLEARVSKLLPCDLPDIHNHNLVSRNLVLSTFSPTFFTLPDECFVLPRRISIHTISGPTYHTK